MSSRHHKHKTFMLVASLMAIAAADSALAKSSAPLPLASQAYIAPSGPLLLTRTLQRSLPDGNEVVTRRTYAIRIERVENGYRVDGTLVDSQVDAPPILSVLAEIERKRQDMDMFPIMLDNGGMIIGGGSGKIDGSLDQAAMAASRRIASSSGLAAIEILQAQAFVRQLKERKPRSIWPADVFNPHRVQIPEARSAMLLPGGGAGEVVITMSAERATAGGQISLLERQVTTNLGGDIRITREKWKLARLDSRSIR